MYGIQWSPSVRRLRIAFDAVCLTTSGLPVLLSGLYGRFLSGADLAQCLGKVSNWPRADSRTVAITAPYSITSSARASSCSENVTPISLPAARLMTSSNFVGW